MRLASCLAMAICLASPPAFAGSLTVDDPYTYLSRRSTDDLRVQVQPLDFDVQVIVTTTDDRARLSTRVNQVVTGNGIAIGINPSGRFSETAFGRLLRVARTDQPTVSRAGNPSFKQAVESGDPTRWATGIGAIVLATQRAVPVAAPPPAPPVVAYAPPTPAVHPEPVPTPTPSQPPPATPIKGPRPPRPDPQPNVSTDSGPGWGTFLLLALFVVGIGTWVLHRQRKYARAAQSGIDDTDFYRVRRAPPPSYPQIEPPAPPVVPRTTRPRALKIPQLTQLTSIPPARWTPPSPAPPVVVHSSSHDDGLLTGMLLGQVMERDRQEGWDAMQRVAPPRAPSPPPRSPRPVPSYSHDSGGSSGSSFGGDSGRGGGGSSGGSSGSDF